ncbi:unnamed protein product [marine sediment metagenome]|uniref:Zinc-ribbon domain-containing protein n=1 Tax=marine sediment metagenome TaxID=412755 RepID=X1T6K0_9ZZZZ
MGDLGNVKTFGGVGALFLLIGTFIPYVGPIISIIGLIFVFIAVKSISELAKDHDIFSNYLYHFIFSIISIVAIFVIILIGFGAIGGFSWITSLQDINITDFSTFWDYFGGIIGYAILALFVGWILGIIAAIYLRRSYNSIAKHTKVGLFRTTGTVYFVGAITTIILIGFVILFIGRIIEIIAYFSLPDKLPTGDKKEKSERKCPNCDREIPEDAISCPYCSKKLT